MPSRLTVITGPEGVDIGPVAAHLGRHLDDGLAIRVINYSAMSHTSPDPYHGQTGSTRFDERPLTVGAVRLRVLPSAWQDPQTNLGVVYDGPANEDLTEDLHTMDALGLNPAHRVTVQHRPDGVSPMSILDPVEVGNLGIIARDSVLRAGGRVQIEAGDGRTLLSALATVGIPPWAEWIDHLDRWIVLDGMDMTFANTALKGVDALTASVRHAVDQLDGSSGAYGMQGDTQTLRVALLNAQMLIPGIAAHDYNARTDEGDTLTDEDGETLAQMLDRVTDTTGVEIHLIGTGRVAGTGVWSWIYSDENA